MDHLILNNGSDGAALAEVALKALREARNSKTSSSGSIFVSDGQTDDDGIALGTGTIINGVDGGIQPWVGDTTPPGKPTGLSVSSKNAAVIVSWGGSMEGGEPLDWGHLQLLATDDKGNDYDFGVLYGAGSQQLADLTPGAKLTVWAVGYDDAHDAQGNSTPNASTPSDSLTVTVESAVDPAAVQKAQDDAQSALNQAGQAVDTATASKQESEGAKADAANAVTTANSANDTSTHAFSTAQSALTAAQSAQQDTVTQWVPQYAVNQSTTDAPTTGWSVEKPSWTEGHYIWLRTVVGYGSGDYTYSNPVLLTGNTGPQGQKGDTGAPGPAGVDGKDGTSVNIKGSVASASQLPSSAMVGDGYLTDDTGHLYVWGDSGWTDVGAIRGPNGVSAYVHTAWADSSDGTTDFSLTDGGTRTYIGVYADNVAADSTTPGDYTWTRIVGPQGPNGLNGSDGVSVTAITPYWALGTSAPAQPAVAVPPSPWQSTEPGYSRNQHLYKTSKVTYSNGQFAYMPVVMDSSYEYSSAAETAAQDAVQTATNANTTAQTAKSTADSAVSTANAASSTASTAQTTADGASSVATQANATAVSANQSATSAQTAANLALANAQELIRNPTMRSDVSNPDGWPGNVTLGASGAPFTPPTPFTTYAKVTGRDHNISWTLPNIPGRVIQYTIYAVADSTATQGLQFGSTYVDSNGNTQWYAAIIVTVARGQAGWAKYVGTFTVPDSISTDANRIRPWLQINGGASDSGWYVTGLSIKDITEAQAAQKAANDAQATADTANATAQNATAIANAAKAAAQGAQTTADGKNKIFSSATQPSSTGLVPGDLWFQLDSSKNVTGIQVWNGSAFVDYVLMANQILVAGSVGTIQLANGAVTADQITASEALLEKLLVRNISADEIDVGSLAAAIVTSGLFQTATSGSRVVMDSTGIRAIDNSEVTTVNIPSDGGTPLFTGGFQTSNNGNRVRIATEGDAGGSLQLLEDADEVGSLRIFHDVNGAAFVQLGAGVDYLQIASQIGAPNPDIPSVMLEGTYSVRIGSGYYVDVNGTVFAHDAEFLPTSFKNQQSGIGRTAFVSGERYRYVGDFGAGSWQPYDTTPVTLFHDETASYGNTVTLSDSAANYKRLVIYYLSGSGKYRSSVEVTDPDGKNVSLTNTEAGDAGNVWLKSRLVNISGTSITDATSGTTKLTAQVRFGNEEITKLALMDVIAITEVRGYLA